MKLTKLLLSKLVQACEEDWMPDNDGGLFGEPKFVSEDLKELKRLVYRPQRKSREASITVHDTELIER